MSGMCPVLVHSELISARGLCPRVVIEADLINWASTQRLVSRFIGFVGVKCRSVF